MTVKLAAFIYPALMSLVAARSQMRTIWGTNYPDAVAASWRYDENLVRECAIPSGDFVISSMQNNKRFMTLDRHNLLTLSSTPKKWDVFKDRVIYVLKSGEDAILSPNLRLIRESTAGRNDVGLYAFYECEIHRDEYGNTVFTALIMEQISGRFIRSDGQYNVYLGKRKEKMNDGKYHRYRWTFSKPMSPPREPTRRIRHTHAQATPVDSMGPRNERRDRSTRVVHSMEQDSIPMAHATLLEEWE